MTKNGNRPRLLAPWLYLAVLAVASMVALLGFSYDYLYQLESQSIFMSTRSFYDTLMLQPGGLLAWAGAWLTQLFYHPVLGASVYTLALCCLAVVVRYAMALPRRLAPLAVVPSAMLLLSVLMVGYALFSLPSPGFVYANLLGACVMCCVYWLYRSVGNVWARMAVVALAPVLLYRAMGCYVIYGTGLCCLDAVVAAVVARTPRRDRVMSMATACVAAASALVTPWAVYRWADVAVSLRRIYIAGLPAYRGMQEWDLWLPYLVMFAFLAACVALRPLLSGRRLGRRATVTGVVVYLCSLLSVFVFRASDPNMMLTFAMDRAIDNQDWRGALDARERFTGTPTRVNVLLSYMALWRLGQAGNSMFAYPCGSAPYNGTDRQTVMRDIVGQSLPYHMGRLHTAYRWCMEYSVEYGFRVDYLKYMVRIALMNGELRLARKYLEALSTTMFHKDWAERYKPYLDDTDLIYDDPEFASLRPLTYYRDHLGGDGGKLEAYLMPITAALKGGSPELLELSLQCCLLQKDLDQFMQKLPTWHNGARRMPTHFQEAVLLWSMINNNDAFRRYNVDQAIYQRFNGFMRQYDSMSNLTLESRGEVMREAFGNTFWHYFFFAQGMKTH